MFCFSSQLPCRRWLSFCVEVVEVFSCWRILLLILPSRICSWTEHPEKHSACIEPNGLLSCLWNGDWGRPGCSSGIHQSVGTALVSEMILVALHGWWGSSPSCLDIQHSQLESAESVASPIFSWWMYVYLLKWLCWACSSLCFTPVKLWKESDMKGLQHYGLLMYSELKALLISFAMNETI